LRQGLPLPRRSAAPLANSGRSRCQTAKLQRSHTSEDVRSRSPKRHASAQQIESSSTSRASSRHAMRVTHRHRRARGRPNAHALKPAQTA
jgi:hypothetical protein